MRYVWLTSGAGAWTNEEGAKHVAKKKAGVHNMELEKSIEVSGEPVTVVGKEEFLQKCVGKEINYYGIIRATNIDQHIAACVGVLNTTPVNFECVVDFIADIGIITERVKSSLSWCYEAEKKDKSPSPISASAAISRRDKPWIAVVAIAMIAEDRPVPDDLGYDKENLKMMQRFE